MLNLLVRISTILALFTITSSAIAISARTEGWSKITNVYTSPTFLMIALDDVNKKKLGCTNDSYYALSLNDENYNLMSSLILSAYMAKKNVHFWVSDEPCSGQGNSYPKILAINVID